MNVVEAIDSGAVPISPHKRKGIVADWAQVPNFLVVTRLKANLPRVTLATGAGAVASKNFMGEAVLAPVFPLDFEYCGPMRRFDAEGARGGGLAGGRGGHDR